MARTTRLTTLPPDIEAALPAIRDEWLAVGLSTEPANRSAAEAGVAAAYRAAGKSPPALIIWLRSPLEGAAGAAMLRALPRRAQVWDQVGDQVRAQVWDQVWDQVRAQVRDQVGDQVRAQVWDQVWAQVRAACWGQHDANWLAFYAAFARAGIEACGRLDGLGAIARSAGWWWAYDNAVILTERPTRLQRDDQNRLHSADGAALLYPDGWGIWAWHGVRVPQQVIESPDTLTPEQITNEPNAEIRRVMVERFGMDRYVKAINATVVDASDYGTLYKAEFADDEPLVVVEVINATPEPDGSYKPYMLRVPPTMERTRDAVAWTFGQQPDAYRPAVQS